MDWIVEHLESIIGMLVTGAVSIFAMYKANNQNYQLAFYQKVIDKRLKAYELVEDLLEKLDIFDATTEQMYYISNPILIRDLIPYFSSVMKMRIWLSKEIFDYLNLLNSLLVSYLYYINRNLRTLKTTHLNPEKRRVARNEQKNALCFQSQGRQRQDQNKPA